MPKRAFITVVTRNYAHYAQVLMQSCRRHHPEADLFVCYVDRPPASACETVDGVHTLYADDLGISNWRRFAFQYTPFELSTALKPVFAKHVLERGYDHLVYLDGDMQLYGPLTELFDALARDSIVLTPHLLKPLPNDGRQPHETEFLTAGAYNSGMVAVRNDATSHAFLAWWSQMCERHAIVDLAASLFVDQKWFCLVPGMFDNVRILRHPGYNAGHWSLSQFVFDDVDASDQCQSRVTIDGKPLMLLHFTGMTPDKPHDYLKHQTRTSLEQIPGLRRLVQSYHQALFDAGMGECVALGCQFSTMKDGTPIHPAWREAVRRNHALLSDVVDPFDVSATPDLLARFRSIEGEAYKWRRDWRLNWPKQQGVAGAVRRGGKRFKGFLRRLRSTYQRT